MAYTNPVNITSVEGMFNYANVVSGGIFSTMIPVSLWFIVFFYLKTGGHRALDCMIVAGFFSTIVAIMLRLMNLLDTTITLWFVAVTIIPVAINMFQE